MKVQMAAVAPTDREEFLQMAVDHFRGLNPNFVPEDDWKQEYFETIQANPDFFLRWILYDEKRVGFILFGLENHRFLPRRTGAVYELYVLPEFRRRGIARASAAAAIWELWKFTPSKIQLEVVEGNEGAAALWRSLGFQKVTERYVLTRASA